MVSVFFVLTAWIAFFALGPTAGFVAAMFPLTMAAWYELRAARLRREKSAPEPSRHPSFGGPIRPFPMEGRVAKPDVLH